MLDVSQPIVVDFSHQTSPFEQLWPSTHRALLPIIGKPIIVHTLERLRNMGYRHFRIARHLQQPFVKNRLGNGEEWGVTLRYSDLMGPELLSETLSCFGATMRVMGDELLPPGAEFSSQDKNSAATDHLSRKTTALFELTGNSMLCKSIKSNQGEGFTVRSVRDYQTMCFQLCRSFTTGDTAPGTLLHRSAQADWKTSIAPDVLIGGSCFVGKHCKIDSGAVLERNCVLGNGVYVDKKSLLRNCVVLPNTYIGPGVSLQNCVASPLGAVHVSGEYAGASVKAALRSTRPNKERLTGLPCEFEKLDRA